MLGFERFSQAPRRWMGVVAVAAVGVLGVMGLELRGPEKVRGSVRPSLVVDRERGLVGSGVAGRGLLMRGAEKAEPMSERVSERTRMRSEGAIAGTWWDGDNGIRFMRAGAKLVDRYASARRSSTMVLSSRIASSTSVLTFRMLPGPGGAVLERGLEGDGSRESMRLLERIELCVLERCSAGGPPAEESGRLLGSSSSSSGSASSVADACREWSDVWLCTLERRDPDPTGFR